MIADGLYERLVNEVLVGCLKNKKKDNKLKIKKDNKKISLDDTTKTESNTSQEISKLETFTNNNESGEFDNNGLYTYKRTGLTEKQIEKSIQYLLPYYVEGTRNSFALGFSGLAYKELAAEESAAKIIEGIYDRTEEFKASFLTF